jgi:hypothetical protein
VEIRATGDQKVSLSIDATVSLPFHHAVRFIGNLSNPSGISPTYAAVCNPETAGENHTCTASRIARGQTSGGVAVLEPGAFDAVERYLNAQQDLAAPVIPLRDLVKAFKQEGYRTWQEARIKGVEVDAGQIKGYQQAEFPGLLLIDTPIKIHVGDFVRENWTASVEWNKSIFSKVWDRMSS